MLNPHTFPFAPYPGLAPEQAVRSAMGAWEAHALPIPADRLLPFVFARAAADSNSAWLNCARLEHADTGALLQELRPTGAGTTPAPFDLLLRKYVDAANGLDYFVYMGGQIPGLTLPCDQPVRLILENAWQGPRCLANVSSNFLLLEWWNDGPTGGVPYGSGFRQRLYVEGGAVQHGEPVRQREVTKSLADDSERVDAVTLTHTGTVAVPPVPAYLAQALETAETVKRLEADGAEWQLTEAKPTREGADGGRWSVVLTLRQRAVTRYRASCPAPALSETAFDPARNALHPWRCGDLSDASPEWQTEARTCAVAAGGGNTGYVNLLQRDVNPQSPSYNTTRTAPYQDGPDLVLCPLPVTYYSARVDGLTDKHDCPAGYESDAPVYFFIAAGARTSQVSQAAADALAQADYDAQAQANANATGTCRVAIQWRPAYDGDGCFDCLMANVADPTQQRDATAAEVADYFRRFGNDPGSGAKVTCRTCS